MKKEKIFTVTGKKVDGTFWSKDYFGGHFYCSYKGLTELFIPEGAVFEGSFDCSHNGLTELVIPEGTVFGGSFVCSYNKLTKLTISERVSFGGSFDCRWNELTQLVIPDGVTFGGSFYCSHNNLVELNIPRNTTFGDCFDCNSNQLTKLIIPPNAIFCGWFDCRWNKITQLVIPEGVTFGSWFDCSCNQLTELVIPDGVTFGDPFYCNNNPLEVKPKVKLHQFQQGECTDRWVYADGILSTYETKKQMGDKTIFIGKIYTVVLDANKVSAHGKNLRQAIRSYNFKIADKDTSEYEKYDANSIVTAEKAYEMYRVITGACEIGTENFISEHFKDNMPDEIKISEIIEITKNKYGHKQFREFFS